MDRFRRAILPILVVVVLLAALIFRLSSCVPDGSKNGSLPAENTQTDISPSAASSPSPSSTGISPNAPYSGVEIKSIYESLGLAVVEIRDADEVTMVHYYSPSGVPGEIVSRFDWFDRSTGARDLVFGWSYTDKFEIKADKTFTVLTTGLSYVDGGRSFPKIFTSSYSDIDGAVQFTGTEAKYYAPLAQSYTVGVERRECLTDINFNDSFMSLGFDVQPGHESEFYTASESIPKMSVINEAGYSTITLYKTILSENFKNPANNEKTYCRLESVSSDGTDTTIVLKLNESTVTRYNVSTERSPESGLPYAVIEYTNIVFDYPAGW